MSGNLNTFKKVELNGKEYLLKFDYNATCDLEDIFGKGIAGIMNEEQVGFKMVRAFYWAGLKWKEKGITLERVGNMLGKEIQENGATVMGLFEPVMEALTKSKLIGKPQEENDEDDETNADAEEKDPNA